jgi:hypothetical protein
MLLLLDQAIEEHLSCLLSHQAKTALYQQKEELDRIDELLRPVEETLEVNASDEWRILEERHDSRGEDLPSLESWKAAWRHVAEIFGRHLPSEFTLLEIAPTEVGEIYDGGEWARVLIDGAEQVINFVQDTGTDYPYAGLGVERPYNIQQLSWQSKPSPPSFCDEKGVVKLNPDHPNVEVVQFLRDTQYDRNVRWD